MRTGVDPAYRDRTHGFYPDFTIGKFHHGVRTGVDPAYLGGFTEGVEFVSATRAPLN